MTNGRALPPQLCSGGSSTTGTRAHHSLPLRASVDSARGLAGLGTGPAPSSVESLRRAGAWPFPPPGGPKALAQVEQTRRACAEVGEATW